MHYETNFRKPTVGKSPERRRGGRFIGYPGACTIDISDELYKQNNLDIILPRHEQALVHEADAYARTTGKVGVCLVTSGPGATNLVTGLATANYDSVPLGAALPDRWHVISLETTLFRR